MKEREKKLFWALAAAACARAKLSERWKLSQLSSKHLLLPLVLLFIPTFSPTLTHIKLYRTERFLVQELRNPLKFIQFKNTPLFNIEALNLRNVGSGC